MISGITQTRCLPSQQPCTGYLPKDLHFNWPISLSETDCDGSLSLFFHSGVASMAIFRDIFENPYCKNWNYLIMFISSCKTTRIRKYTHKNNFWNNYDFPQRESPKLLIFLGVDLAHKIVYYPIVNVKFQFTREIFDSLIASLRMSTRIFSQKFWE